MGADLLLAACSIEKETEPDWDKALSYIESLSEEFFEDTNSYCIYVGSVAKENAFTHLETVKAAWNYEYRDTQRISIREADVLISGGTSWGDSPSETFDAICGLEEIGALKAAGFD